MKKILIGLAILLMATTSCRKEPKCGVVIDGHISYSQASNAIIYELHMKWDNGGSRWVSTTHQTYVFARPGDKLCF